MTTPQTISADFQSDPRAWLQAQAQQHGFRWLLAHADDGVIWGRMEGGQLLLSGEVDPQTSPPLLALTLQQARLFGESGELLIWKDDLGWHESLFLENAHSGEHFDQRQVLWGDQARELKDDFTRLTEKTQNGMAHCPPLAIKDGELKAGQRLALLVRHYVDYDQKSGEARIAFSRLADLSLEQEACS